MKAVIDIKRIILMLAIANIDIPAIFAQSNHYQVKEMERTEKM